MTAADIQRVEQALSVKSPADYRHCLLDYPFSEDSFATACMVINNADALISLNRGLDLRFWIHHRKGRWAPQKNYFMIGNDGGEGRYYVDLDDPTVPVLRFHLETGEVSSYARGMEDFKAKITQVDREIEEDEKREVERRRSAKWWQLWRKL